MGCDPGASCRRARSWADAGTGLAFDPTNRPASGQGMHKQRRYLARLLSVVVLAAGANAVAAEEAASGVPERLSGVLARAHGSLAFAPCDGHAGPAVDVTAGKLLTTELDWLLDGRDGGVRVEVDAVMGDEGWRLTHLRRAGHVEPECPREVAFGYVWSAAGEGGWRMLATPRSVRITGVEGLDGRRFRFRPFVRGSSGVYHYVADAGEERLLIELAPGLCRSQGAATVEAEVSDYRSVLVWRGRRWAGCAHNGRVAR